MATFKSNYESMKIVSESGTVMFNSIFFDSTMFFRHFSNNLINSTKTLSEIPEIKDSRKTADNTGRKQKGKPEDHEKSIKTERFTCDKAFFTKKMKVKAQLQIF